MAALSSQAELLGQLGTTVENTSCAGLLNRSLFSNVPEEERSENAKEWLSWTCTQSNLKNVDFKIPSGILPPHLNGELTDVKVASRGPDDKIYDQNSLYRKRVARGNCVMKLQNQQDQSSQTDCVIFALKKFTGGLGKGFSFKRRGRVLK